MLVADHMTPDPVVIAPDFSTRSALTLMDDLDIRHLPVVKDGHLVGIVSDRDLLSTTAWRMTGSSTEDQHEVRSVMHRDVVRVTPDDQIVSALVEVVVGGIGCLPVVEGSELIGIVTEKDLLDLYVRVCRDAPEEEGIDPPVREVAHADAVVVSPDATVTEAGDLCHHKGFRHLPVVEGHELVGILSDRDLRRSMGVGISADATVEGLMTRIIETTSPDEALSVATRRMIEHKIGALPMIDGTRIGIVTTLDVLDYGMGVIRDSATSS